MSEEERIYEELKKEWQDQTLRRMVKHVCGEVCYNCGSTENVQYHHIVPLRMGGTNKLSNIAVLCSRCHKAAHRGRHISHYLNTENMGRPRTAPAEVIEDALNEFFQCKIGTMECAARIGLKGKKAHLSEKVWYQEYLKEHKIKYFQNRIDMLISPKRRRHTLMEGECVGVMIYENGERKEFFYTKYV